MKSVWIDEVQKKKKCTFDKLKGDVNDGAKKKVRHDYTRQRHVR